MRQRSGEYRRPEDDDAHARRRQRGEKHRRSGKILGTTDDGTVTARSSVQELLNRGIQGFGHQHKPRGQQNETPSDGIQARQDPADHDEAGDDEMSDNFRRADCGLEAPERVQETAPHGPTSAEKTFGESLHARSIRSPSMVIPEEVEHAVRKEFEHLIRGRVAVVLGLFHCGRNGNHHVT